MDGGDNDWLGEGARVFATAYHYTVYDGTPPTSRASQAWSAVFHTVMVQFTIDTSPAVAKGCTPSNGSPMSVRAKGRPSVTGTK